MQITIQKMRDTLATEKVYHMHICEKACLICGYHTKDTNASKQPIHKYCLDEYVKHQEAWNKEHKNKCSMCDQTRVFVEGTNVCKECLDSAF